MNELAVPQLGEGLREVRIVEILRRAGDTVTRGEPGYVVETDKSTVELEAPFDGTIERWTVSPGDVVPVGAVVARVTPPGSGAPAQREVARSPGVVIPPRTRAHARERGSVEAQLARIPSASGKLMPADVDAWIARNGSPASARAREEPLSPEQRRLVFRMRRSAERVIPGTIAVELPFAALADSTPRDDGFGASEVRAALRTGDQAGDDTQLLVSHLGREGIVDAVPALVAPAGAVLFLGAPRADGVSRLVMTFDHRLHNGAGAAAFLAAVRDATPED